MTAPTLPTGQVKWRVYAPGAEQVRVTFVPSAPILHMTDATDPYTAVVEHGTMTTLDGDTLVPLPATDGDPAGWTWTAHLRINGALMLSVPFELPAGQVVDLAAVVPVRESAGVRVLQGPRGPQGDPGPEGPQGPAGELPDTDTEREQYVPARLSDAAMRAALGPAASRTLRPNGARLGVLGDSIMSYDTSSTSSSVVPSNGATIYKQVELLTGLRVRMTDPMQDPGDTIDDVLNTQLPALLARTPRPNACAILIGRNNVGSVAFDLAAFMAKYEGIGTQLADAGIAPIPHTMLPTGAAGAASSTSTTNLFRVHRALRDMCHRRGWPLIDLYSSIVDPTGGIKAAYDSGDHTHLTRAGYQAVADSIIAQGLPALFPPANRYTLRDAQEPFDAFGGTGSFTSASPTGWGTAGATISFVNPVAGENVVGRWAQIVKPSGTSADTAYRKTIDGTIVPGHVYEFAGRIKGAGFAATGATVQIAAEWRTAAVKTSADLILNNWSRDEPGWFAAKFTAPAGVDGVRFVFYQKGTPSADAPLLISEVVCRDLTAMNLPA